MTFIAAVPLIVTIAGLLLYLAASDGKAAEVGRLLFAIGALVSLLAVAGHVLRLG